MVSSFSIESLEIVDGKSHPHLLPQLGALFDSEWPDVSLEATELGHEPVPFPIMVLLKGKVVGGVAFTRYAAPNEKASASKALWVNALLVDEQYRGCGVATVLLKAASQSASKLNEPALYALTEIPALYQKSGWQCVKVEGEDHIMQRRLR